MRAVAFASSALGAPILLGALVLAALPTQAQQSVVARHEAAEPVRIELYAFEFQELRPGREGPGYSTIPGEPSKGARQLAQARLSGQAGVATAKFEALDATGSALSVLHLFKLSDALDDDQYLGFIEVPDRPFRVMVSGQDSGGGAYRRVFDHLFRPRDEPPARPVLLTKSMREQEVRYEAEFESRRRANPDGVIVMPHMQVTNVMHEPYRSGNGNILGIRLSYDVRFSRTAFYSMTPAVDPFFESYELRGSVGMKVAEETITPEPAFIPEQYPPGFHGIIMPAQYEGGVLYHFVVDMVPDYAIENAARTRYCIYNRKFQISSNAGRSWERLRTQEVPVRYLVSIRSVNYYGEIAGAYPQKELYEGFLREGAGDCGANPGVNF
jgi:hypothetical protein